MYYVYIIKSKTKERFYTGSSENVHKRLNSHNSGKVKSTKAYKPQKIVYLETFENKNEALKREKQIKSYKSGNAFKKLITCYRRGAGVVERGGLENRQPQLRFEGSNPSLSAKCD